MYLCTSIVCQFTAPLWSPLALSLRITITSYTSLLYQSSDDMSFSSSRFVFHSSSFSFCPSAAPFIFLIHPFISFPFTLRWSHLYGRPFTCTRLHLLWLPPLSHLLYYHCFFPLPCTSRELYCVQHIVTCYCLVFQCFDMKKKNQTTHFHHQ